MKQFFLIITVIFVFGACGSGSSHGESEPTTNIDLSDTYAYNKNSPYSSVLKECIQAKTSNKSCTLEKLPLIGENVNTPITKKMIMNRVVVSHKWMGERFSQMLDILEDDVKYLLGSTTMIVIDNNVRPSFYWTMTGAIYIDPRYLFLNPREGKTIEKKDDYRKDYGKDLQFEDFDRYVKNNNYAYKNYKLDSKKQRTIEDIKYKFAQLFYHELGHANDYIPSYMRNKLDKSKKIVDAIEEIENERISLKLKDIYPLTSQELKDLGAVLYHGKIANQSQKDMSAYEVGELFSKDSALDMYAYSNSYEDLSVLFETFLMKYHYGIENDVAFLKKPSGKEKYYCEDYIVKWGKRNLLAQDTRSKRALFVVNALLPNIRNWNAIDFGEVKSLKVDSNWCSSINISSISPRSKSLKQNTLINIEDFKY